MKSLPFLVIAALLACATPQPTPTPNPVDIFDGIVADCSRAASPGPVTAVLGCLDAADTAPCIAGLAETNTLDTIACTVRALTMRLHVLQARGAATGQQQAAAAAADAWIRSRRIGYR